MSVSKRHLGKEVPEVLEAFGKMSQNTRYGSYGDEAKLKFPVNVIPNSLRPLVKLAFNDCPFVSEYAMNVTYQVISLESQV